MSTLDILGNTSEQADSVRLMLKIRGMKDGHFIDDIPPIILKADNHLGLRQMGRVHQQVGVSDRRIVWHARRRTANDRQ